MKIRKLNGKKEDQEGFELVYLKAYKDIKETPHCKKHGAMNKMKNGMWRCFSEYGFIDKGHEMPHFIDRICNACCMQEDQFLIYH